jgi:LmbE family N-acetylglucosaminyl deacetylase/glycosyltransferase involved in cell wall biosynthesis
VPDAIVDNGTWPEAHPVLSVLVPFHRDDPVPLLEALASQRIDDVRDVEVVVLDDGTGDDELADAVARAVAATPVPTRFVRLTENVGRGPGRNVLSGQARAAHLLFLDADMLPDDDRFLARWVDVARTDPAVAFGGFSVRHTPHDRATAVHRALSADREILTVAERRRNPSNHVFTSNLLVRRDALDAEPFDDGFAGWGWEDVDWALRAGRRWTIEHVDNPATHVGLQTAAELLTRFEQSVPNFARLIDRHPDDVSSFPIYATAQKLTAIPFRRRTRPLLRRLVLEDRLPASTRSFLLRLHRAELYADAVPGQPVHERARRWLRETTFNLWDRRLRPPRSAHWKSVLVISPHLDDAVLSCGEVLASRPGSVVATVFTEHDPARAGATPWDRECGFAPGDDVMGVRRREDEEALGALAARPVWLGLVESQYTAERPVTAAVEQLLEGVLQRQLQRTVLVPLGVSHGDHELVSDAVLAVARRHADRQWLLYEEVPYRADDDALERRRVALAARGIELVPTVMELTPDARPRARAAARRYRTQSRPLWAVMRRGASPVLWELAPR